jgi:hypothetical protein
LRFIKRLGRNSRSDIIMENEKKWELGLPPSERKALSYLLLPLLLLLRMLLPFLIAAAAA